MLGIAEVIGSRATVSTEELALVKFADLCNASGHKLGREGREGTTIDAALDWLHTGTCKYVLTVQP